MERARVVHLFLCLFILVGVPLLAETGSTERAERHTPMTTISSGARERLVPPPPTRDNVERWIRSIYLINADEPSAPSRWYIFEMKGRVKNRSMAELVEAARWAEILHKEKLISLLKTYGYARVRKYEFDNELTRYEKAINEIRHAQLVHPDFALYVDSLASNPEKKFSSYSVLELSNLLETLRSKDFEYQNTKYADRSRLLNVIAKVENELFTGRAAQNFDSQLFKAKSWNESLLRASNVQAEEWLTQGVSLLEILSPKQDVHLRKLVEQLKDRVASGKTLFEVRSQIRDELKHGEGGLYQPRTELVKRNSRRTLIDELKNLDSLSPEQWKEVHQAEVQPRTPPSGTELSQASPEIREAAEAHLKHLRETFLAEQKGHLTLDEAKHQRPWLFGDFRFFMPMVESISHGQYRLKFVPDPHFRLVQLRQALMFNSVYLDGPSTDNWKVFRHAQLPFYYPANDEQFFAFFEALGDSAPGDFLIPGGTKGGLEHGADFDLFSLGLAKTFGQGVMSSLTRNAIREVGETPFWIWGSENWQMFKGKPTSGINEPLGGKNDPKQHTSLVSRSKLAAVPADKLTLPQTNNGTMVTSGNFKYFLERFIPGPSSEDIEVAVGRAQLLLSKIEQQSSTEPKEMLQPIVESIVKFMPPLSPHPHENKEKLTTLKNQIQKELKSESSNITLPERFFLKYLLAGIESTLNIHPHESLIKQLIWQRIYPGHPVGILPN